MDQIIGFIFIVFVIFLFSLPLILKEANKKSEVNENIDETSNVNDLKQEELEPIKTEDINGYFLTGHNEKLTFKKYTEVVLELSNNSHIENLNTFLGYIDEESMTKYDKSAKKFNIISISFQIACFTYSTILNANLDHKYIDAFMTKTITNILDIKRDNERMYNEEDLPFFDFLVRKYISSIQQFLQDGGQILGHSPGDTMIEDLAESYNQPVDSFCDMFNRNKLAEFQNLNIRSSIESVASIGISWKSV